MSSPLPVPPSGFDALSRAEQLDYIEQLLNYVQSGAKYVDIPEWHREQLTELMARYREVGFEGTTWEDFQQELEQEST
ncbi:MAG TPA: addiction module protein [Pyrinomonadaceae bacterium]|nr:addiction module protein [Pyrinomonadaceae bacterium]